MKLSIFQSDAGDCLLLEADSGHLVLCDGGMRGSVKAHVRDVLGAVRDDGRELDLVYVSHIDNDHISGVLQLLEDEAEWRVFDFHQANGDPIRPPRFPRPPAIRGILHNAFRDQVPKNNKKIENLLIAAAPALYATAVPELLDAADHMQGIAAGIPEALKVSGLVGSDALDIPVNQPPGVSKPSRLLYAGRPGDEFTLGTMKFTLIGPTKNELESLREGWNNWLDAKANQDKVKEIQAELKKRIEEFSSGVSTSSPYDLRDWNGVPDFKRVTAPNVASLMFMVEEDGKTLLLTGDAQQDFILAGLVRTGFLEDDDASGLHIDVLKVQHHGSENNMDETFARKVSADHYVFCGNGSHENPDRGVIDMIFNSRVGEEDVRALAPDADGRDFHFWFSTSSALAPNGTKRGEVFAALEEHVNDLARQANGRLHLHFNEEAFTLLEI